MPNRWSVCQEHIDSSRNLAPDFCNGLTTVNVECPIKKCWRFRTAPELNTVDHDTRSFQVKTIFKWCLSQSGILDLSTVEFRTQFSVIPCIKRYVMIASNHYFMLKILLFQKSVKVFNFVEETHLCKITTVEQHITFWQRLQLVCLIVCVADADNSQCVLWLFLFLYLEYLFNFLCLF